MAKGKTIFVCQSCGYESSGWLGKCPSCSEWHAFVEEKIVKKTAAKGRGTWHGDEASSQGLRLDDVRLEDNVRLLSQIPELDRVLGGGFVKGSLSLIGGDPGIGKSTLLLQVTDALAKAHRCLYVSGEESPMQIRMRADRLGVDSKAIVLLPSTNFERIAEMIEKDKPDFVVVDSIQTIYMPELTAAPGSVSQVREATAGLLRLAKGLDCTMVLVGHVTKDGAIAGPRLLEHMVDTVLYFEGEGQQPLRVLRSVKNRFGKTDELGLFEMSGKGLTSVDNPSVALLQGRPIAVPGTTVTSFLEGSRPLLIEIQALLNPSRQHQALRMSQGIDRMRLSMLLAVLEKYSKKPCSEYDCYVNVTGGLRIKETASDLAVVAAVLSSMEERPLDSELLMIGELGLSGEIRSVPQMERRVMDAVRLGWRRFMLPSQAERSVGKNKLPDGCDLYYVSLLNEAIDLLFQS